MLVALLQMEFFQHLLLSSYLSLEVHTIRNRCHTESNSPSKKTHGTMVKSLE